MAVQGLGVESIRGLGLWALNQGSGSVQRAGEALTYFDSPWFFLNVVLERWDLCWDGELFLYHFFPCLSLRPDFSCLLTKDGLSSQSQQWKGQHLHNSN